MVIRRFRYHSSNQGQISSNRPGPHGTHKNYGGLLTHNRIPQIEAYDVLEALRTRLNDIQARQETLKLKSKRVQGLYVTIEHPKGTVRQLKNDRGETVYKKYMHNSYGYINHTVGRDGDEVDCFIGPDMTADEVYIVHMKDLGPDKDEREDEDKCFLQFPNALAAKRAFLLHYPKSFYDGMTAMPLATFKQKLKTASLPYRHKKIHAVKDRLTCPKCRSKKIGLMPTDFETAKCSECGKTWATRATHGAVKP